jgi:hypothetical protein
MSLRAATAADSDTVFEAKVQMWLAGISLAGMLLAGAGFLVIAGYMPPPRADWSPERIAEFYADNTTAIRFGLLISFFGWAGWGTLVIAVSAQLKRADGSPSSLSRLAALGGGVAWTLLLLPTMLLVVATFRPERDPALTQTLHDIGWITAFYTTVPFIVQALAISAATLANRSPYPRWVGYFCAWCALTFAPGSLLAFFKTGPFAYQGIFVFWVPFAVFGAYVMVLIWAVWRAARADLEPGPRQTKPCI